MRAVLFKRDDDLTENNTGPRLETDVLDFTKTFSEGQRMHIHSTPGTAVASAQFSTPITLNLVRKHCTREWCASLTLAQANIN